MDVGTEGGVIRKVGFLLGSDWGAIPSRHTGSLPRAPFV